MRKIEIAYIINSFSIGGSEKVLVQTCNNLDQTKYSINVLVLSPYDPKNSILNVAALNEKVKVHYFNYTFSENYSLPSYLKLAYFKPLPDNATQVLDFLRALKPSIIHFHTSPRELVLKDHLKFKTRFVFTDHSLRITEQEYGVARSKLLAFAFSKLYRSVNTIAVSPLIFESLRSYKILDRSKKNILIENCVDEPVSSEKKQNATGSTTFVYVSRISETKGHAELLHACSELKKHINFKLYVVGPDSMNGALQSLSKTLGLTEQVIFTGPSDKVSTYLSEADIGVFPSHKEGLPLALLEKMAFSLPVIAADIPELRSVLAPGCALFFPKEDAKVLFLKMKELAQDRELQKSLGQNAHSLFRERYSCRKNAEILDNFYISVLND
jgi:glycosyltransferase involved in cell wall biosynthesis